MPLHIILHSMQTFPHSAILMDRTSHSVEFLTTPFPPTWVDFPHPVSPATTTIWFCSSLSRIIRLYWKIGRFSWSDRIFFSLLNCRICQWVKKNYQTITVSTYCNTGKNNFNWIIKQISDHDCIALSKIYTLE